MRIIINSDDFGINAAVNRAVIDLFRRGAISSATLLVDQPGTIEAAALAREHALPVGLHFNLTYRSLFKDRRAFERAYLRGALPIARVESELQRQFEAMLGMGLQPTHIDSHQHVHRWPRLFRSVASFAQRRGVAVRLVAEWPVRGTTAWPTLTDGRRCLLKCAGGLLAGINRAEMRRLGGRTNTRLLSAWYLMPRPHKLTLDHLARVLRAAREESEYMCHASPSAQAVEGFSLIGDVAEQEYRLMADPAFVDCTRPRS